MSVDLGIKTTVFIVSLHYEYKSLLSCQICLNIAIDGRWAIICNLEVQIKTRKVKLLIFSGIVFYHWLKSGRLQINLLQETQWHCKCTRVRPIVTVVLFNCGRSFCCSTVFILYFWLGLQWGGCLFADREWSLGVCWRVLSWWMWVLLCFRPNLVKLSISLWPCNCQIHKSNTSHNLWYWSL